MVDAYCESIAFSAAQCEQLFAAARALGLPVRLHTEQISNIGGSRMAAQHGALACDHLEYTREDDVIELARAGTVAVMLPVAWYVLADPQLPPIDLLRKHGVPMAVASDANPGSAPGASLQTAMHMARRLFGMTGVEVLDGVTRHAARALGLAATPRPAGARMPRRLCRVVGRLARRARLLDRLQPLQHGRASRRDRAGARRMSELLQAMDEWRAGSTRSTARPADAGTRSCSARRPTRRPAWPCSASPAMPASSAIMAAAAPRRARVRVRKYLANLAWHGTAGDRLYDAGDVACRDEALEAAQAAYAQQAATLLRAGHRVIGLGGGHEIAWASYQGIAAALHDDPRLARLGIVNFDAHFDLRQPELAGRGTSGTPFLQIAEARAAAGLDFRYLCLGISETANTPALFDRAASLGVELRARRGHRRPRGRCTRRATSSRDCDAIYCTFCLDVLPPAVAPGVSAPSGLGVPLHRAIALLRLLRRECREAPGGDKLVLADVAELAPCFDAPDARTARTAARIVYELAAVGR